MRTYEFLKRHCKYIFYSGVGNYWYEERTIGDDKRIVYKLFSAFLLLTYISMTILEIMAVLIGNFPKDEEGDATTFSVSHTIVLIKFYTIISNKNLIKQLNKKIVQVCEVHEETSLIKERYRIILINVTGYSIAVYGATASYIFDGFRKLFSGSHFVTIVTYYPTYEDNSPPATCFRVLTTSILLVMMMAMIISVDSFTMIYLILFKYKIITLRRYFESLWEDFERNNNSGDTRASEKLTNGLIEGIIMHAELLRICKDIDKAFGNVIAMQLCLSSGSAVSLLLQLALAKDLTFIESLKIIFFVAALYFLLALFLCNAGDITYQASLLSDAIFHCGWHTFPPQRPPQRNLRRMVVFAIAQAQRPVVMKAFKMVPLTHATFLSVVRTTYSVFALLRSK